MHTRSIVPVRSISSTSGSTAASCLGSMLMRTSGHAVSRSSSSGISLAVADPRLPHRGVGQVADDARAVGEAVEVVVVEGDQHPVAGGVGIGLEVPVAQGDGGLERGHGVLARAVGAVRALVGERQGAGPVEERQRHRRTVAAAVGGRGGAGAARQ